MYTRTLFFILFLLFSLHSNAQFSWSTASLSDDRNELAACRVGDKLLFAGGFSYTPFGQRKVVDIYDIKSGEWSVDSLSENREEMRVAVAGNKAFFVGWTGISANTKLIDVYDADKDEWSVMTSPGDSSFGPIVAYEDKVYFKVKDNLDVYDCSNESWTTIPIPDFGPDHYVGGSAGAINGKLFFGGVYADDRRRDDVTIYDIENQSWSTDSLSVARSSVTLLTHNNKVYFAGGILNNYYPTNVIDIYDTETNSWSVDSLSIARFSSSGAVWNDHLFIAGGSNHNLSTTFTRVDVLNTKSGEWQTLEMGTPRYKFGIAVGDNQLFFAGAREKEVYTVDILTADPNNTTDFYFQRDLYDIYPNPITQYLNISIKDARETDQIKRIDIYAIDGMEIYSETPLNIHDKQTTIDLSKLHRGEYLLKVVSNKGVYSQLIYKN